jgi:RimJ/RimL family protein N-acetyltransferase
MATSYRQGTTADIDQVARLHADSWRAAYRGMLDDAYLDGPVFEDRHAVWCERLLRPPDGQFVVVTERNVRIVGFACAYAREDSRWGSFLDNIHAHPGHHGEGIGTGLIAEVVSWCRHVAGDYGLYLYVFALNERARRFYERLGAADTGFERRPPGVGGELRDIHRYAWPTLDAVRLSLAYE